MRGANLKSRYTRTPHATSVIASRGRSLRTTQPSLVFRRTSVSKHAQSSTTRQTYNLYDYEPRAIFISDVHRRTCRLARQACAAGHPPPLAAAGCAESLTSSCTGYCRLPEPPAQASRHLASRHLASRHLVLCHLVPATSYSATSIRDRRHRAAADAPRPSATW